MPSREGAQMAAWVGDGADNFYLIPPPHIHSFTKFTGVYRLHAHRLAFEKSDLMVPIFVIRFERFSGFYLFWMNRRLARMGKAG